jgi:molybdate transport system ATP-binding protein
MCVLSFQCRHRYASGFDLDVSFEIAERFTSLFGPSGSGKTSVLAIIAGLLRPNRGSVRVNDRTLLDTACGMDTPPAGRKVGVVFQDSLLFPHLKVQDNLRYGQRYRRRPRRRVDFARVVEVLELGPLLRRSPHNLSGGEKQRVALGRALLSGPEMLILDEPLASLDDRLKGHILAYLAAVVAEWNMPALFVTHSQAEVRRAAQWVVVIDKGRVVGCGPPAEALAQPASLAWTNVSGPVNLLRIEDVTTGEGRAAARIGHHAVVLPSSVRPGKGPAFLQFRPTDVTLAVDDVAGLSARNHLSGRVCQVLAVDNAVFVAVDAGQIVWAEITSQAANELQIETGREVVCLLKAHCLTLVE